MIYLALISLILAVLCFQRLIRDGKIPRPNGPKGLPTRIVGLVLLGLLVGLLIYLDMRDGFNRSSVVSILTGIGAAGLALMRAKRRQEMRQAGIEDKGEMKRSLVFLGVAVLVAFMLVVLTL